jgi:predicted phage-related endonuclease
MRILSVVQGTDEWRAIRAGANAAGRRRRPASLAPVIMGESPHMKRDELIRMWATGDEREFTEWEEKFLLAKGHEAEAAARPLLEEDLGEDFYPVTITDDTDLYLASMDGLTMEQEDGFEHKLWNAELALALEREDPPAYLYWQMEHQFLAGDGQLKRIHAVCSDGTRENWVRMAYTPVAGRAEQLRAAWDIFEQDVANYVHVEQVVKPTADVLVSLPALKVDVSGAVMVSSNLERFGEAMQAYIDRLPKTLETDQDFANAEDACKVLEKAEKTIKLAEDNALAQVESVESLRRLAATIREQARQTRLNYSKLVEAEKVNRRNDIKAEGQKAIEAHTATLNQQLGGRYMPAIPYDLALAMKGKKTIASLRDAVNTEVMRFKVRANEVAGTITTNLRHLSEAAAGASSLFPDLPALVAKEPEHFALIVQQRLTAEAKRVADLVEGERARIRAEEEERARKALEPAPAATPSVNYPQAPGPRAVTTGAAQTPVPMPSRADLVAVVAAHYGVSQLTAGGWLTTHFNKVAA